MMNIINDVFIIKIIATIEFITLCILLGPFSNLVFSVIELLPAAVPKNKRNINTAGSAGYTVFFAISVSVI